MEEVNREELILKDSEMELIDTNALEHIEKKSNKSLSVMLEKLLRNDKILPILFYAWINRQEKKSIEPYWTDQLKNIVEKAENLLEVLYALDDYTKDEERYNGTYKQNKPVELLEVIRPHVYGISRQKIDQAIAVNDCLSRLKENKGDLIEVFENITDILEILEIKKGTDMKKTLNKAKEIIQIMKR
ncbi:hypothetical protein [Crassaminicella indica]|uniref:Uncharacterized protein n=1 Tax=Crassaminicella indica TaxID=2855394 RepID=A0ABX8R7Y9_9CLOT|nr:hypothetical protein [Crassaminicella indica]QXM05149.1 hypothetical protein KVH43_06995 [Crassaminicella indica]